MRILAVAAAVLVLAACNSDVRTAAPGPLPVPSVPVPPVPIPPVPVPSVPLPSVPLPSVPPAFMLVADSGNNSVFVFPKNATGPELPLRTITSPALAGPSPIAAAPVSNYFWVASHGSPPLLLEFSLYDSGDVVPFAAMSVVGRIIPAPHNVTGMVFDAVGRLYVSTGFANEILVFAAAVRGRPTPLQDIAGFNTTISDAEGIAIDSAHNIYVASRGNNAILEFAAGADRDAAPIRRIQGFTRTHLNRPSYVAVNKAGDIFVLNAGDTITEYAPDASGDVAPIKTIIRADIGTQMLFDASGNLFLGATSAPPGAPIVLPPPVSTVPSQVLDSPVFQAPTGIYAR